MSIDWLSASDAEHTWRGWPSAEPALPLDRSYAPYYMQSWPKAFRDAGVPATVRYRWLHGRRYGIFHVHDVPDVDERSRAAERAAPERWHREWLPEVRRDLARLRAVDLTGLPDDDLGRHFRAVLDTVIRHCVIHASVSVCMDAVQRLVEWYLKRFPGASESEPYVLVQGLSNTSVENGHRLWELAQMEAGPAFDRALAAYLDDFGYRAGPPALAWPLWRDDPAPALALVRQYRESGAPDPMGALADLGARRQAFTAEVRARLTPAELAEFDDLLATALAANPIREDHAYWLDQQSGALLPPLYREIGRRLAATGAIDALTDVGFLTLDELQAWTFGCAEPLRARIDERKAEHERDRVVELPEYVGAPPAPPSEDGWADRMMGPIGPTEAPPGEVRGIAASAGVVRGAARVARTLEEARALRRGEVLVCPATDPDWAPLFGIAAALVTDSGGSLCHGAVVAREYALPAVVGTHRATATIQTGQVVEVDGAAGVVRLGPFAQR